MIWPFKKSVGLQPGALWVLKSRNKDPWGNKEYPPVTILDVREGWVRYKIGNIIFTDERMEAKRFTEIYRPYT